MSLFETGKRNENRLAFLLTLNFFYSNAGAIQTLKFTHQIRLHHGCEDYRYIKKEPQDYGLTALFHIQFASSKTYGFSSPCAVNNFHGCNIYCATAIQAPAVPYPTTSSFRSPFTSPTIRGCSSIRQP